MPFDCELMCTRYTQGGSGGLTEDEGEKDECHPSDGCRVTVTGDSQRSHGRGQCSTVRPNAGVATGQVDYGLQYSSVHTHTVKPLHTTNSSTLFRQDVLENHSQ